jgi:hypothetical protein
VGVEEICDEGEIELWVTGDEGRGCEEFAAFEKVGVVEDLFGSLKEIAGLEWGSTADVWCELVQEYGVVLAVFDV